MAHPLLDRRDMTRARDQAAAPAAPSMTPGLADDIAETNRLLRDLLLGERAETQDLCVTDREPPEQCMENFPINGVKRYIVRRAGAGGTFLLAAATPRVILEPNENRLGGRITNDATNPVTLFLSNDLLTPGTANPLTSAAAQIRVPINGWWDMKLGDVLWCGHVIALDVTGGANVTVAEV